MSCLEQCCALNRPRMASASVDGAIWTFPRISVIVAMKEEPAAMVWFVGERAAAVGLREIARYIGALIFTASSIVVFTAAPVGMPIFFASSAWVAWASRTICVVRRAYGLL